jgi:hypothetical protein
MVPSWDLLSARSGGSFPSTWERAARWFTLAVVFLLASAVTGCELPVTNEQARETVNAHMAYARDDRTGLSFAFMSRGVGNAQIGSLTNVPCSAQVLSLISDGGVASRGGQ